MDDITFSRSVEPTDEIVLVQWFCATEYCEMFEIAEIIVHHTIYLSVVTGTSFGIFKEVLLVFCLQRQGEAMRHIAICKDGFYGKSVIYVV